MKKLLIVVGVASTVVALAAAGQAQTSAAKPAAPAAQKPAGAGAAAAKSATKTFVSPKTPWGDPDLQGNFTNKDEANTPLERPDECAGRKVEDVTPQELAAVVAARQQNALESAPFITGSRNDGIAIGVPIHWLDHLDSANSRPWFIVDPPDGKIPPQTEEAAKRAAAIAKAREGRSVADSYTDRSYWDRCIARAVPAGEMQPKIYGNSFQILQTKDYVAIRYEMVHETRVIPIEGRGATRPHNGPSLSSYWGDATARFDGTTLVIDGKNYNGKVGFRGSNDGLRTVERFRRTASNKIEWTTTIEDSQTWTRPWTFSIPLTEDDGQPIFEYACHEGNYGLRNILAGAREDQKRGIVPSNGPALPPGVEQQE